MPVASHWLLYADVLTALDHAGVRSVVVGGFAVVLHGHLRTTIDLDISISLSAENIQAAVGALTSLGFVPRVPVDPNQLADEEVRASWIREKGMQAFTFVHPDRPLEIVDVMVDVPIAFNEMYRSSREVEIGSVKARVASIPHLIQMKEAAGRPQDLADIEALRKLEGS